MKSATVSGDGGKQQPFVTVVVVAVGGGRWWWVGWIREAGEDRWQLSSNTGGKPAQNREIGSGLWPPAGKTTLPKQRG